MAGLFGLDDDASLGLLTAALAAMSARGVRPGTALAQGGLLGIGAMQNAKQGRADAERQKREDEFRQMQMDDYRRKITEQQAQKQALSQAFQGAMIPGQQAQPPVEFGGGEGTRPGMPAQAPGFDYAKFAQMIGSSDPGMAMQAMDKLKPKEKTLKDTKTLTRDGKRVTVNFYTDGTHEIVPFDPDMEKPHFVSTGDRVGVPVDPYKGTPLGQGLPAGVNPAEAQRIALERAKFGYQQGRDRVADAKAATAPNLTDPKAFDQENKLRDEYVKGSQEFVLARDAYSRIQSAAKSPSAAGDIALVFNYMKMLDPKSTVREGEYATAANAGSVPAQIIAKYNAALSGKFLADDVRNDFVNRAGMLYGSYQNAHKKHAKTYSTLASQYKLKPENVALDLEADVPSGSGATGQWGKARVVSP